MMHLPFVVYSRMYTSAELSNFVSGHGLAITGAKPSPETVPSRCQLGPAEQKFLSNYGDVCDFNDTSKAAAILCRIKCVEILQAKHGEDLYITLGNYGGELSDSVPCYNVIRDVSTHTF